MLEVLNVHLNNIVRKSDLSRFGEEPRSNRVTNHYVRPIGNRQRVRILQCYVPKMVHINKKIGEKKDG